MQSNQTQKKTSLGLGLGGLLLIVGSILLVSALVLLPPLWIAAAAIGGAGLLLCVSYGVSRLRERYKTTPPVSVTTQVTESSPKTTDGAVMGIPNTPPEQQRINPFIVAQEKGSSAHISVRALLRLPEAAPLSACIVACRKQLLLWHPDRNPEFRHTSSDKERTQLCETMEFWLNVRNLLTTMKSEICYIRLPCVGSVVQPNLSPDPDPIATRWINIIKRYDDILVGYERMNQPLKQLDLSHQHIQQQHVEIRQLDKQIKRVMHPLIAMLEQLTKYREKVRQHTQAQQKQLRTMNRFSFFGEPRTTLADAQHLGPKLIFQESEATRRHSF
ncbi:MAG: hypothetical protein A3J38_07245 [Gammaproteobacteria bacterium RIFCSPHIGHO2_12_FULL_45_9]|nr:MAG: hypothetical protein A3J38_07245 [Gammaproteobacteria bacterium RIFCSPHIGHO2_12_FULL_45_9]